MMSCAENLQSGVEGGEESEESLMFERQAKKRQEAREKRALARNQIQANCSRNEGGVDILKRLPMELWGKLFEYVKDPQDLDALWKTSPVFQTVLASRRMNDILLPMVLNNVTEPQFTKLRRALGLQKVCKKLALIADERDFEKDLEDGKRVQLSFHNWVQPNFNISVSDSFRTSSESFIEKLHPFSPRVRIVEVNISYSDYLRKMYFEDNEMKDLMEDHYSATTKAMEAIGSQVWMFELTARQQWALSEYGVAITQVYETIRNWLALMLNLKCFYLQGFFCENQVAEELKGAMLINPLPTLESLKCLEIFIFSYNLNEDVFTDHVLQSCPNLTDLAIHSEDKVDEESDGAKEAYDAHCKDYFAQIVHPLKLESLSFTSGGHAFLNTEVAALLNPNWKLKRICLRFKSMGLLTQGELIQVLEMFPTLEDVCIEADIIMMINDSKDVQPRLRLPNVTRFDIRFTRNRKTFLEGYWIRNLQSAANSGSIFKRLDFLLPMGKLKELLWRNYTNISPLGSDDDDDEEADEHVEAMKFLNREQQEDSDSENEENVSKRKVAGAGAAEEEQQKIAEVVQFEGGRQDMYKSNIWDYFPYLKRLIILPKFKKSKDENRFLFSRYEDDEEDTPWNNPVFQAKRNEVLYERSKVMQ